MEYLKKVKKKINKINNNRLINKINLSVFENDEYKQGAIIKTLLLNASDKDKLNTLSEVLNNKYNKNDSLIIAICLLFISKITNKSIYDLYIAFKDIKTDE